MGRKHRALGFACALALAAGPALAAPVQTLSAHDLSLYAAAFDAAERGDPSAAEAALAQISDPCLAGKIQYLELTHGGARGASYEQLSAWLKSFGDLPGAGDVYQLALRKKPADAALPTPVQTLAGAPDEPLRVAPASQSHAAREAYFSGRVEEALDIARVSRDAWIAGLAAYRLGDYPDAMVSFETLAANPAEDAPTRAAGGVWAAKAAVAAGQPERAAPLLKIAAAAPDTFYGMIARRKLELADDPVGRMIADAERGAVTPLETHLALPGGHSESAIDRLIRTDPRAHRAVALAQLSRGRDAAAALRAGDAEAPDDAARALWMGLMFELSPDYQGGEIVLHAPGAMAATTHAVYPVPDLKPEGGFTIDKSLVYAVTWQESRFNSLAVSPVGAVGLMQIMPPSAATIAGDPTLKTDPIVLFDRGRNLQLGQSYLAWLRDTVASHDLLRTIAAYNAGPGALSRTLANFSADADSLLVMESMPAAETRAYVKKVMAAYWSYRRQFGATTRTLDAAASDAPIIDARFDGSPPAPAQDPQTGAAPARQALEILLTRGD